jgi:hypothetical protein
MIGRTGRLGATIVAGLAPLAVVTVVSPAVGNAAECGQGPYTTWDRTLASWRRRRYRRKLSPHHRERCRHHHRELCRHHHRELCRHHHPQPGTVPRRTSMWASVRPFHLCLSVRASGPNVLRLL